MGKRARPEGKKRRREGEWTKKVDIVNRRRALKKKRYDVDTVHRKKWQMHNVDRIQTYQRNN